MKIELNPIGFIRSAYEVGDEIPRQSMLNKDVEAKLIIDDRYKDGLRTIEAGDFLEIVFYFHKSTREDLSVVSRKSGKNVGVFNSRSPNRPNHLGISIIEVIHMDGGNITFKGVDMLNNTPIIDIKPMNDSFTPNKGL